MKTPALTAGIVLACCMIAYGLLTSTHRVSLPENAPPPAKTEEVPVASAPAPKPDYSDLASTLQYIIDTQVGSKWISPVVALSEAGRWHDYSSDVKAKAKGTPLDSYAFSLSLACDSASREWRWNWEYERDHDQSPDFLPSAVTNITEAMEKARLRAKDLLERTH